METLWSNDVWSLGKKMYTVLHMFTQALFWAGSQGNHQNFDPSLLSKNLWLFFMGLSKKKFFFSKKKIQNGRLKKTSFCQTVNSQYFFAKLSGMGPWVSRIDWCEGHWFGSTYMAVRLSDIRPKTGKKWIFCVFYPFLSLCWTASRHLWLDPFWLYSTFIIYIKSNFSFVLFLTKNIRNKTHRILSFIMLCESRRVSQVRYKVLKQLTRYLGRF